MDKPSKPERWEGTRTAYAPPPVGPGAVNRIDSVVLAEGERVRWEWTYGPGGTRFVSGYRIRLARRSKSPPPRPTPRDRPRDA
jgi:hypothetical protein